MLLRNFTLHIKENFLVLSGQLQINSMIIFYGNKLEVRTDNNPLTYVLGTAKFDAILVSASCSSAENIPMSQILDVLVDGNDLGVN